MRMLGCLETCRSVEYVQISDLIELIRIEWQVVF